MLLSTPVAPSPARSTSPAHPPPPSPSLLPSAASAASSRSVLRRYQQHIAEQPPAAATHKHSASTQSSASHAARPPVYPQHHSSSSLPGSAGPVPSGLVRMRLSQYLAMCEANNQQHQEPKRLPIAANFSAAPRPASPRLAVSSPSHPHAPHHGQQSAASHSATSPLPGASPAALSSVHAVIAALNIQAQRPPVASALTAQQQLVVAGRVRSLAKAYTELQRQHQQEKQWEREKQHSQRAAEHRHASNKRPAAATHNSVLAAVPHSSISLRRRHSDSRMLPAPAVISSLARQPPNQPVRSHRTYPRSSLRRPSQPSSSALLHSSQSRPPRAQQPAPRIRFRRSCLVRQYSRCQAGSNGVPRNGGVSLGLAWTVLRQHSVRLRRDSERTAGEDETEEQEEVWISRRYPSPNVSEELPRLSERERLEALDVEDDADRDELVRERLELDEIRRSRQSNFCNCKPIRRSRDEELEAEDDDDVSSQLQCCTDLSCPCVRDGIGCHVEGNHYCQCNLSSSTARPPTCGNPHGLFQFDEYSVRQHALDILYPSYDSRSISHSHSRGDSGGGAVSTPSSLSPSLSSPSSLWGGSGSSGGAGGGGGAGPGAGLRSASFSFHPSVRPSSFLSSLSYSSAAGGGLWDLSASGGHTPRALLRRPSRVSPPSSPLFAQSGRGSAGAVAHRATG